MVLLYLLAVLAFVALGVYGGICAFHRWWRSETGFVIFEPLWGMYYGLALFFTCMLSFAAFRGLNDTPFLFAVAIFPFGVLGTVMWGVGFALEMGARTIADSPGTVAKTFDRGDAFMTQNNFAEAEREFRRALAEEPRNIEALLRLCRALEAAGKCEDAAQELSAAHRHIVTHRNDPPPESDYWQARLLSVTYALGDLYAAKLNDPERAQRLYKSTLELLFGYRDADPLRERLKRLENAPADVPADSTESAPERLPLDDVSA